MNIFNKNTGDFDSLNTKEFFREIRKTAMDSGYELFMKYGIEGMKKELGSKDPVGLANKLMTFFIGYEEYEKCAELKKLIDEHDKKVEV